MLPQITDLRAEADEFDRLLTSLRPSDWSRPTGFKAWTTDDIVRHLHAGDLLALASATDPDSFTALLADSQARRGAGMGRREVEALRVGGDLGGAALRERWHTALIRLCDVLAAKPADARLKWAGPDMGLRMFTTARQMEVWSHAQAIYDVMGRERPAPSPRLRNVAEIGVRTFGWTFTVHGLPVPPAVPAVRLDGPDGATWRWNDGNAIDRISGGAVEFCQVVTQTRNVADTRLVVEGETARHWMSIAQCFAGPPETPPAKGARYRAAV
ncbi:MAG: TIGR03084 family protein [Enhydrobacter sp.]|nr:MAG: TIGR03084 family protein [Enhydrobacter sp.]